MKLTRCYQIEPLYDLEIELDVHLVPTLAGKTFTVAGMTLHGVDLYRHPDPKHADFFLRLALIIQEMAEDDQSIFDELLEDEAREAA